MFSFITAQLRSYLLFLFVWFSSNFGVEMVRFSNEKIIKAKEVIVVGSQPQTYIETALITLGHLALFSEDVEVEVFT